MISDFIARTKSAWRRDWGRMIRNHRYDANDEGALVIGNAKISPVSTLVHSVLSGRGLVTSEGAGGICAQHNLWTTEGRNAFLDVMFHNSTQIPTWYVGVGSGNVTPLSTWTAANFATNATELTTQISNATRPEYVEAIAAAGSMTNSASPVVITTAVDSVTIWIIGLLSSSTKGGTSGTLMAASKYASAYTLPTTGNTLGITWQLDLTAT